MAYRGQKNCEHVTILLTDTEDDARVQLITLKCGIQVSPVTSAEVIVYDVAARIVFDADYGLLPNGDVVVSIRDSHEVFPTEDTIELKLVFGPYSEFEEHTVLIGKFTKIPADECPLCGPGVCGEEESEDSEDEDSEDSEDEPDVELPQGPTLTNRCLKYFKESRN